MREDTVQIEEVRFKVILSRKRSVVVEEVVVESWSSFRKNERRVRGRRESGKRLHTMEDWKL